MNRALIQRIKRTLFVLGIAFLIGTVIISIAVVGGVFVLMSIGIILTMIEFNRLTDDPSIRKGIDRPEADT